MTINTNKKTLFGVAGAAVIIALLSSFATCMICCHKNTIGVVDLQRVVSVSKDVAALRASRAEQIAELQKMADEANAKIDDIKKDDEKKAATETYLAEIQNKKAEFDKSYSAALQASDLKIQGVINSVAKKHCLSVVLNKTSVVTGGTDITEDVVKDLIK